MCGKVKWFVRLFPADHECRACAPPDQPAVAAFGALMKESRPSTCFGRKPAPPNSATLIQPAKGPTDNVAHGDPPQHWQAHFVSCHDHGKTHAPGARRSLSTLRTVDRLPQLGDSRHVKAQVRPGLVKTRCLVPFLLSLGVGLCQATDYQDAESATACASHCSVRITVCDRGVHCPETVLSSIKSTKLAATLAWCAELFGTSSPRGYVDHVAVNAANSYITCVCLLRMY